MSGLMLLKDVSHAVGGIIPAILIAVLTKNPEAIGLAAAGDGAAEMATAASTIEEIEAETKLLSHCTTIDEAKVDRVHEIAAKPKGLDAGAEYHSDLDNLPHQGNDPEELQHPAGSQYNLPEEENENFSGAPQAKVLPPRHEALSSD